MDDISQETSHVIERDVVGCDEVVMFFQKMIFQKIFLENQNNQKEENEKILISLLEKLNDIDDSIYQILEYAGDKNRYKLVGAVIRALVRNNSDLLSRKIDIMIEAMKNKKIWLVLGLIKGGSSSYHKYYKKQNLLNWASYRGYQKIVGRLIRHGCNVDEWNYRPAKIYRNKLSKHPQRMSGCTSLILATYRDNIKIVRKLIKSKCSLDMIHENRQTTLMYALSNGNFGYGRGNFYEIAVMLIKAKCNINGRNKSSLPSALNFVVGCSWNYEHSKSVDIARILIEENCDVNMQLEFNGNTALIEAMCYDNNEMVMMLIEAKTNLELSNSCGRTALLVAAVVNRIEYAKLLICAKCNIDAIDENKNNALILASKKKCTMFGKHNDIVKLLIDEGCNMNVQGESGYTALMVVAQDNFVEIAQILVEKKCNIDLQDDNQYTALMHAVEKNNQDIAQMLIREGCNTNLKNNNGHTALMIAIEKNHIEIACSLIDAKATCDISIRDNNKNTALIMAVQKGQKEIVQKLIDDGCDMELCCEN